MAHVLLRNEGCNREEKKDLIVKMLVCWIFIYIFLKIRNQLRGSITRFFKIVQSCDIHVFDLYISINIYVNDVVTGNLQVRKNIQNVIYHFLCAFQ